MGGGNDPKIAAHRVYPSHPGEFVGFQDSQEIDLHLHGDVAHFIEQYGAVVLAGMTPDELQGLLQSVCGLEADLLAELRSRGLATAPQLALRDTEAETIRKALEQYRWNITEAAGALGIGRNTLYRKIRQFGLEKQ